MSSRLRCLERRYRLAVISAACAAGFVLFASWPRGQYHQAFRAGQEMSSALFRSPSRLIDVLYPGVNEPLEEGEVAKSPWKTHTRRALRNLFSCIDGNNCRRNQEKVIIVESIYFMSNMVGHIGGEEIWANSTMLAMKNLGYTVLYAEDMVEAALTYRMVHNLVKMVIVNDWHSFECWKDKMRCLQSAQNPTGIPAHKMFSFYFWPFPRNPLGSKWVLSPEPYALEPDSNKNTTYLGYSIEHACALTDFVPHESRPNQAWILAKLLSYFSSEKTPPWTTDDYNTAAAETGVRYALGAGLPDGQKEPPPGLQIPAEYVNHGRMEKSVFMRRLAQSKVLIGIGNPIVSPTPWDALCLGVPWINPLDRWNENNPEDESYWHGQHAFLSMLGKPYVYNVRQGDRAQFVEAIREALANPIGAYVPERMRMSAVERRLEEIVNHDWKAEEIMQRSWCQEPCGCTTPCDA
ncbi:hypothetical protein C8R43DRAFT_1162167 [Mycena crocata]|nr:hypothetical protein C8R43DRAFT_1162167 [Mycena crocata]